MAGGPLGWLGGFAEDPPGNQHVLMVHSRAQAGRGVLGKVLFKCCYGNGRCLGMFLLPLLCSKRLLPPVVCWQSEPVDKLGGATCRLEGGLSCSVKAGQNSYGMLSSIWINASSVC